MTSGRLVRLEDLAQAAAWYFGTETVTDSHARRCVEARRAAYAASRELGFSWKEIAAYFERDHTTVIHALNNGKRPASDDVDAVLANARARALADSYEATL
jgi:chromosomal replication initiation ATPase DnaA